MHPDVEVRAYDLGGFGDIAGALRVASHLARQGKSVVVRPTTRSAAEKLTILGPDVPASTDARGRIKIDVAGHYLDNRTHKNNDVPHQFSEDMDNWGDRSKIVPLYLKSGMAAMGQQKNGQPMNPMFYRPLREWDLPKPGERDVREMLRAIFRPKDSVWNQITQFITTAGTVKPIPAGELEQVLGADRIGFAHIAPYDPTSFFNHSYLRAVTVAAAHYDARFSVGLFLGKEMERAIIPQAIARGFGAYTRDGTHWSPQPHKPSLLFLGPQPQMVTTSLFLSADMPNLVTGDLSLSDGLYGVLAMDGPGFFYDTPGWKIPTLQAIANILAAHNPETADVFTLGSITLSEEEIKKEQERAQSAWEIAVSTFGDPHNAEIYRTMIRESLQRVIIERFGKTALQEGSDGFYLAPGAPFLIQDATANVVRALDEEPELFAEVDNIRKALADGATPTVVVNVETMAVEQPPAIAQKKQGTHSLLDELATAYTNYTTKYPGIMDSYLMVQQNDMIKHIYADKNYGLEQYMLGGISQLYANNYAGKKSKKNTLEDIINKEYDHYEAAANIYKKKTTYDKYLTETM
jgi:hypothetical protein